MSNVTQIRGNKAVEIIRAMVRDWQNSGLTAQDMLDEACERALREGIVTQADLKAWADEEADKAREQRRQERWSETYPFQPIPPWR